MCTIIEPLAVWLSSHRTFSFQPTYYTCFMTCYYCLLLQLPLWIPLFFLSFLVSNVGDGKRRSKKTEALLVLSYCALDWGKGSRAYCMEFFFSFSTGAKFLLFSCIAYAPCLSFIIMSTYLHEPPRVSSSPFFLVILRFTTIYLLLLLLVVVIYAFYRGKIYNKHRVRQEWAGHLFFFNNFYARERERRGRGEGLWHCNIVMLLS